MNEKEALLKAQSYCSLAEKCEYDIRQKLRTWGIGQTGSDAIIDSLLEDGYIDNERYVSAYVHDKLLFSHWGRTKIGISLRQKSIAADIVNRALDAIDQETYEEVLRQVIESKRKGIKGSSDYERDMKLIQSVASRGFELPLIRKFIKVSYQD